MNPPYGKKTFCPRAIDLMDESLTLFLRLPLHTLAIYYIGVLPLGICFVLFCHDMLDGYAAESRLASESLVLTLLYIFAKLTQSIFCTQLYCQLTGAQDAPWTLVRLFNVALIQAFYTATFLIVWPMAVIITVPFPWVSSFYHNVSLTGAKPDATIRSTFTEAKTLALLWPGKNTFAEGLKFIFQIVLIVNIWITVILVPYLLKICLSVESKATESNGAYLSSSIVLLVFIVSFMIMNPITKTYHVLRCFYGRARSSGVDLLAALRMSKVAQVATLAFLCFVIPLSTVSAQTESTPPSAPTDTDKQQQSLNPGGQKLQNAIDHTLQNQNYDWRSRSNQDPEHENWFFKWIQDMYDYVGQQWDDFWKWLSHELGFDKNSTSGSGPQATLPDLSVITTLMRGVLLVAALVTIGVLVSVVIRLAKRQKMAVLPSIPSSPKQVDIREENVRADALPEDSWLAMARELIAKGELRLALRAFYLASLSVMAEREWVRLGRSKSNRDYLKEFTRRFQTKEAPVHYFAQTMDYFEASWYGTHSVTPDVLRSVETNHQQLKRHA